MPSRKRQVLDCLSKRTLVDLSQAFEYTGLSTLNKSELAGFLSSRRSVKLETILEHLKMAEIKKLCMALDVNPGAVKKQVLIDRIVGVNKGPAKNRG